MRSVFACAGFLGLGVLLFGGGCDSGPSGPSEVEATRWKPADPGIGTPHANVPLGQHGQVLTSKNDNGRTGANLEEDVIDVAGARALALLATVRVDGEVYAQPLVAADVSTPAGPRTLFYVATMNDSVYAFDLAAPNGGPVWHTGKNRELGIPGTNSRNVFGNNGILSTPVIDRRADLLYVVSRDCSSADKVTIGNCARKVEVGKCVERLSALELATGAVRFSVVIQGSVPGPSGPIEFDPAVHWNRPALLLVGNDLYVAFGSGPNGNQHEEDFTYYGWLFRYDVTDTAKPPVIFSTTPRGAGASIWQGGGGPASDGSRVFFATANRVLGCNGGVPNAYPAAPMDAEDSVVSLPLAYAGTGTGGTLPADAIVYADTRPYTATGINASVFQFTNSGDNGFGSSGPTLIPGSPDLVVSAKNGGIYLLDRQTMMPRHTPLAAFTELPLQADHSLYIHSWWGIPPVYGSMVAYRPDDDAGTPGPSARIYGWASHERLRMMRYDYATRTIALATTSTLPARVGGGYLSLSANGGRRGSAVLWAQTRGENDSNAGHIWAFDALTLELLGNAETPAFSKFTPPTIVRGRLLVPSAFNGKSHNVLVFGPSPR